MTSRPGPLGLDKSPVTVAAAAASVDDSRLRAALEPRETPDSRPRVLVARPTWKLPGASGGVPRMGDIIRAPSLLSVASPRCLLWDVSVGGSGFQANQAQVLDGGM